MIDDNPFLFSPEEEKEFNRKFFAAYPRWKFHNLWRAIEGFPGGFCPFGLWWSKKGSVGMTLFNFGIEFNPYHRDLE